MNPERKQGQERETKSGRRGFLRTLGIASAAMAFGRCETTSQTLGRVRRGKPNIVLIVADDLGYAELGIQGCTDVPTPSIVFRDTTVTTEHLGEGIAADYDAEGRLAGIEVLDAAARLGGKETLQHVVLEGVGLPV